MKVKVLVFLPLLSACVPTPKHVCDLSTVNKSKVLGNVWTEMNKRHPGHSAFCATDKSADQFSFNSGKGECRIYLPCGESGAKGQILLHGDWIITFDPISSEVMEFYDVAW